LPVLHYKQIIINLVNARDTIGANSVHLHEFLLFFYPPSYLTLTIKPRGNLAVFG
jgi:hypothetical protein